MAKLIYLDDPHLISQSWQMRIMSFTEEIGSVIVRSIEQKEHPLISSLMSAWNSSRWLLLQRRTPTFGRGIMLRLSLSTRLIVKWFLFALSVFWMAHLPLLAGVELLTPVVIRQIPHDPQAFTQGLVIDNDRLYESTGRYGTSSLRQIDLQTGAVIRQHSLPFELFGEGIAAANGQLIQLTWKEGIALVYQMESWLLTRHLAYQGEGWGLCYDSAQHTLFMSDGSSHLFQRNPDTFAIEKKLKVHLAGKKVKSLNDLVCVGNEIYANVWRTDFIVRINKKTGAVTALIDASHLLPENIKQQLEDEAVLNGIAYREQTDTFFITGKLWPFIFEVKFMPKSP